ncbi:MAG: porin [Deltaproteobacteria bacterium]|nr:porin [Deltaproteobacteria bacterium]MBW2259695.1 porin [Deltaproteobacteria bacterium]
MDRVSIGGVLAGAYQYASPTGPQEAEDEDGGAVVFQPEVDITLTEVDEIFFKFGFGAGNGLNVEEYPFVLAPWAANLEDDVKDINGRDRDYLLTAWYKHTFQFSDINALGLTGGIIDATDYLDGNAYSNDEFTQFMNEALVNAPNGFFPSFDIGGAFEWEIGPVSVNGVVMGIGDTGENEDDTTPYNFFGVQLAYKADTSLGEGNYRLIVDGTTDDFMNAEGTSAEESLMCIVLSFDQQFGEIVGGWIRFGTQDDSAAVDIESCYSGGIDINGKLWNREQDNIGIGYANLQGGNQDIDSIQLVEAYVRFGLNDTFALTFDIQYEDDSYKSGAGEDVSGWIGGVRATAEF